MSTERELIAVSQAQPPLFLGIDVGGTNIKAGLVDDGGRTLARTSIPTEHEKGQDDAIRRLSHLVDSVIGDLGLERDSLAAIGVGTPGSMDVPAGIILDPHNLPSWRNFSIRDRLSKATGRPVAFANDATAAAYGEFWVGSGSGYRSIILLTLGTGIGGGIIVGDQSIDGEHSHGAECGHTIIDYNDTARLCGCGQPGHLEAYTCASAVVDRMTEALQSGRKSSVTGRMAGGEPLTPLMLAQEAEQGDALSLETILDTAMYLGIGIVTLMHTIDPATVILGGAMNFGGHQTQVGRRFIERVRDEVRRRAFPVLAERTVVEFASLGGDAGYVGAAGIARAELMAMA